jgi:hypothetical protein
VRGGPARPASGEGCVIEKKTSVCEGAEETTEKAAFYKSSLATLSALYAAHRLSGGYSASIRPTALSAVASHGQPNGSASFVIISLLGITSLFGKSSGYKHSLWATISASETLNCYQPPSLMGRGRGGRIVTTT